MNIFNVGQKSFTSTIRINEPKPSILLIDDDKDDLEMLSSELELKGLKVKAFESSAEALCDLVLMSGNKERPSLIIMDYNMPRKNGHEVLSLLKNNADTKDIPVIIYSTNLPGLLREQLSNAGALNCFTKPWKYSEFTKQVERFQELAYSLYQ
jgi:CheY-like chemotaxis protein